MRWERMKAKVAELVDAPDLGSGAVRRESLSLSFRTSTQGRGGHRPRQPVAADSIAGIVELPMLLCHHIVHGLPFH